MPEASRLIALIGDIGKGDQYLAGGKGANLGELTRAGIAVPPGFVVTVPAYEHFFNAAGLGSKAESLLGDINVTAAATGDLAGKIRALISEAEMPEQIASGIAAAYVELGGGAVAVRSSATAEDLAEASFAGQQETFLNIEGEEAVIRAVQQCWGSLFGPHAVHYRATAGFGHLDVSMAVVVQHMVQSDRSGVMFTLNPVTNDASQVLIEAVYGLGEGIVSGILTPDMYVVDKRSGAVLECQVTAQEQELVRCPGGAPRDEPNHWVAVDWERRGKPKLSDDEIAGLARLGVRLEQHFGCAQDIEWACEGSDFYIVQSRPVTTHGAS